MKKETTIAESGARHAGDGNTLQNGRGRSERAKPVAASAFVWGAGIECSFVPHQNIDQFEWTQHNRFWKDDFKRAKEELGLSALRYSLPWHQIETKPGTFAWDPWDQRVQAATDLGLELYLDVMHFGTPTWLGQAAGDPEFPEALERFSAALVERYSSMVHHWCPCNEPLILALFSGDFGFWPPHARKWRGYMPVLSRVMQATSRSIRAIRRGDTNAKIILCDHVENYKTRVAALEEEVARRNQRRFLAMDLLLGRVGRDHPLFDWITAYGFSELDLAWFTSHPERPDILGIDYYPNGEWQLDQTTHQGVFQRRSETPLGLYGIAQVYYQRYGIPLMLTETSTDGHAINREIWLEQTVEDCRRLREEGIPLNGYFWWPMIDQVDWDGALTHRIGKIHDVGVYNLRRQADGALTRHKTALADQFANIVSGGDRAVGQLAPVLIPLAEEEQLPLLTSDTPSPSLRPSAAQPVVPADGQGQSSMARQTSAGANHNHATGGHHATAGAVGHANGANKQTDTYGIVVFSHLRWGFVWQRPQQFLSRFARNHDVVFVEEPFFDLPAGAEPRLDFHQVMPRVTVICLHLEPQWQRNPRLPALLREQTRQGIDALNDRGRFDRPLLWYYSPMDSAWSLGHFANRGIVYDCMDELSNFTGAPASLISHEARLMEFADVVFTGGLELGEKKSKQHPNVHAFGCGVDYSHFSQAADSNTGIPPDIDFMKRPILGWFGVVDERVDYALVGEMARLRPNWSFAMVGPVVKVDPGVLPHFPNLYWLGGRDYQQLPHYCRAFDVNMMCFAINDATRYINPTKGLEYMATGKPIVGTPIRDVVRQWSEIVRIARTAEEFVGEAEAAMAAGPGDSRVVRGIELARNSSWEATVESMQRLIREAIGKTVRPSARGVTPLSDSELEAAYQATQGS